MNQGLPSDAERKKDCKANREVLLQGGGTFWFKTIIHCVTHIPILALADLNKSYVLHIDASLQGLGAVLNQEYPEGLRPVAFAIRKLSISCFFLLHMFCSHNCSDH